MYSNFSPINKCFLFKLKDPTDTVNCCVNYTISCRCDLLTLDKENVDNVSIYINTNSIFEIKKPINPPLLNIAGKVIIPLIFILQKLFPNPVLYLYWTSFKHSISIKIIIMLSCVISPSLVHQTVGNLTLNLISPDSS